MTRRSTITTLTAKRILVGKDDRKERGRMPRAVIRRQIADNAKQIRKSTEEVRDLRDQIDEVRAARKQRRERRTRGRS